MTALRQPLLATAWDSALTARQSALLLALDRRIQSWAVQLDATELVAPVLLAVGDLQHLDYYDNFPQQAVVATQLAPSDDSYPTPSRGQFRPEHVQHAEAALPPAACYGIYLRLTGKRLAESTYFTTLGQCCRAEDRYEPLARQLGFHMREIVAVGTAEFAQSHIDSMSSRILEFGQDLGLRLDKVPAADPFFDGESSKAQFAKMFPVKHEFVCDGLAIASVNIHRTYFGDKLSIAVGADPEVVSTSCVAFGLERWVWALENAGITPADLEPNCVTTGH